MGHVLEFDDEDGPVVRDKPRGVIEVEAIPCQAIRDLIEKAPQQVIAAVVLIARQKVVKRRGHWAGTLLAAAEAEKDEAGKVSVNTKKG